MNANRNRPPGPSDPNKKPKRHYGKSWVNNKGQILIYHNGKEYNVSNWELLNAIL